MKSISVQTIEIESALTGTELLTWIINQHPKDTELYKVSQRRDSITETWYFKSLQISKFQKILEIFFAPNKIWIEILENIYVELQDSEESTTHKYFFLCVTHAKNKVSRLCHT